MPDAAVTPLGRRNRLVVHFPPRVRLVMSQLFPDEPLTKVVVTLVMEALLARGFSERKMSVNYIQYAAKCARQDIPNEFPGERL